MIRLNKELFNIGSFPDGTIAIKQPVGALKNGALQIDWFYENEREFICLIYLVKHLHSHGITDIKLFMPYIPNARMDRVKDDEDVFTLKYFCEMLNSLKFSEVTVLDPHSNVSQALIENIKVLSPKEYIEKAIKKIAAAEHETPVMFYPDEGAGKRYSGMIESPYAFGIKRRDWKSGLILGLDIAGDIEELQGKNVLIVDDICSKGGTFFHSSKKLKEIGANNVYLFIAHCEKSILDGELIKSGLVKKIFTTDSICHFEHELIEAINL